MRQLSATVLEDVNKLNVLITAAATVALKVQKNTRILSGIHQIDLTEGGYPPEAETMTEYNYKKVATTVPNFAKEDFSRIMT
jgi:hypothetical protein